MADAVPADEGKEAEREARESRKGREVESLAYSLDNGKSFTPFRVRDSWKFRLETQSLHDGDLGILVRRLLRTVKLR